MDRHPRYGQGRCLLEAQTGGYFDERLKEIKEITSRRTHTTFVWTYIGLVDPILHEASTKVAAEDPVNVRLAGEVSRLPVGIERRDDARAEAPGRHAVSQRDDFASHVRYRDEIGLLFALHSNSASILGTEDVG